MQIRKVTNEGRVVSHVRALHPTAAPHAWEAAEGIRLSGLAEPRPNGRNGDTLEVWLDAPSLAVIDAVRKDRSADEAAILEDAQRYRKACVAVHAANGAYRRAPTADTAAALTAAWDDRIAAETALKLTARAGTAGRMPVA